MRVWHGFCTLFETIFSRHRHRHRSTFCNACDKLPNPHPGAHFGSGFQRTTAPAPASASVPHGYLLRLEKQAKKGRKYRAKKHVFVYVTVCNSGIIIARYGQQLDKKRPGKRKKKERGSRINKSTADDGRNATI